MAGEQLEMNQTIEINLNIVAVSLHCVYNEDWTI